MNIIIEEVKIRTVIIIRRKRKHLLNLLKELNIPNLCKKILKKIPVNKNNPIHKNIAQIIIPVLIP
jgi:hypothetical protein